MRLLIIFSLLFSVLGCRRDEVLPAEVSEIPEEEETPKAPSGSFSSAFYLPKPENPSDQTLLLKHIYNIVINSYGTTHANFADTAVYQYNINGEVVQEYFTNISSRLGRGGENYLNLRKYIVSPENLNVKDHPYVRIEHYPGQGKIWQDLYCDDQKRVVKDVAFTGGIIYYEYDEEGRLVRENREREGKVIQYSYFDKKETGLANDYYTQKTFKIGSSTPIEEVQYILSNILKKQSSPKYAFNYGKSNDYWVVKSISKDGAVSNYSYTLDGNDRVTAQEYKSGNFDLWEKYIYE